ncbi:MAG: glucose-1-phosphate adenylyltransferase [Gammaproteobacteria bacterium]|nr:glucose-1-phosphate adenylyltransferase [Gammaproteobacteria bacterium]MDP2140572.1 glucose-1-phosphate adenylyltransferase [Gammaproteobacteria bacterium]MDP2347341.1 glucose-1-phosphate adenylyltransferase [Gammaproteobacteria bacterium]
MKNQDPVKNTLAVILAGGSGTRLQPLTDWCAKPAIPFGGKFRTIDFTLSNCLHSEIRKICILTQYKSHSLNQHIQRGWSFLQQELGEFVELIPAQQRVKCQWYQGTADALFQNLDIFQARRPEYVLVLAGDHVYTMDYGDMIRQHVASGADLTVGCVEVPVAEASAFGVMGVDADNAIVEFVEKPMVPRPLPGRGNHALASMGIYVFNTEFLYRQLVADALDDASTHDFGHDIIPSLIGNARVHAYPFRDARTGRPGYWRDVGTLDSYYESNLELCKVTPALNLYDRDWPIWTCQEQLPPAKFVFDDDGRRGMALDSLVSAGCIVSGTRVKTSVLFNNVHAQSCSDLEECIVLDNAVIGRNCRIRRAIIDTGCHIPPGSVIGYDAEDDARRFTVSPKGVVLVTQEMLSRVAVEEQLARLSSAVSAPTRVTAFFLLTGGSSSVADASGRSDIDGDSAW